MFTNFKPLQTALSAIPVSRRFGRVIAVDTAAIRVGGLSVHGHVGDQIKVTKFGNEYTSGEIIALENNHVLVMPYGPSDGIAIGDLVELNSNNSIRPAESWVGRIIDAFGEHYEHRKKFSELAVFWYSEIGPLNEIIHVWPYADAAERDRVRAEASASPHWPPPIREHIVAQTSELFVASPATPEFAIG